MNLCFVIMPYGRESEQTRKHYEGVYRGIIVPAAQKAGFDEVKRSDLAGEPGDITQDIIRDLADADVVIADLTDGNANVFFELGIRHSLRKSGTVHVIDSGKDIPFDVRQYRAIQYTTELAELAPVIDEIEQAIRKRLEQPERSDNPVHDTLPGLPIDLRSAGDEALRKQLEQFQAALNQLQLERDTFEQKLRELDPAGSIADDDIIDVDAILDQADQQRSEAGEHALLRLTTSVEKDGKDGFVRELRTVLKSPYLSENDFAEIANMCVRLGLTEHRLATLEVAHRRFPAQDALFLGLASAYEDSSNRPMQERGRVMVENYIGVEHVETGPVLRSQPAGGKLPQALGVLFNFYHKLSKPEWVVSIASSVEEVVGESSLISRNKAVALAKLGRTGDAEQEFKRAIEMDPQDDNAHTFYASFLDDQGRVEESYREHEKAILADPDDSNCYVNLAIHILNQGIARTDLGKLVAVKRERQKYAMPLILHALAIRDGDEALRARIVSILVRAKAVEEASAIARGGLPDGKYDTSALEHLLRELEPETAHPS